MPDLTEILKQRSQNTQDALRRVDRRRAIQTPMASDSTQAYHNVLQKVVQEFRKPRTPGPDLLYQDFVEQVVRELTRQRFPTSIDP